MGVAAASEDLRGDIPRREGDRLRRSRNGRAGDAVLVMLLWLTGLRRKSIRGALWRGAEGRFSAW